MIAIEDPPRRATTYPDWQKRALDLGLSIPLGLLLLPLCVVIALAVKLTSPGPALFRQLRVGRDGNSFWLFKFRSMRAGGLGPNVTAAGDARITPLGLVLRGTKLDELPQFLNVLKGEMSLVGPRPEVAEYVEHYTNEQREVLAVRPGITGLSQIEFRDEEKLLAGRPDVKAYYLAEILPRKLEIDRRYVLEASLRLDVRILALTALALVRR